MVRLTFFAIYTQSGTLQRYPPDLSLLLLLLLLLHHHHLGELIATMSINVRLLNVTVSFHLQHRECLLGCHHNHPQCLLKTLSNPNQACS